MKTGIIVQCINDTLKASLTDVRFSSAKYYGIAVTHEDDGTKFAACYTLAGEASKITPDDSKSLLIFHKNNGSVTRGSDAEELFGNQNEYLTKTTNMSMVVIGQRKALQLSVEDLESLIEACIPYQPSKQFLIDNGLLNVSIYVNSASYNSLEIYNREFQKDKKNNDPRILLCEVKYSIECSYNIACINSICS